MSYKSTFVWKGLNVFPLEILAFALSKHEPVPSLLSMIYVTEGGGRLDFVHHMRLIMTYVP